MKVQFFITQNSIVYSLPYIHRCSKTSNNQGCPICSNHKLLEGYNDLATTCPEIAKEWNYDKNGELKPTMVMKGSERKVWWKCSKCGCEWESLIYSRTGKRQSGCKECNKKK